MSKPEKVKVKTEPNPSLSIDTPKEHQQVNTKKSKGATSDDQDFFEDSLFESSWSKSDDAAFMESQFEATSIEDSAEPQMGLGGSIYSTNTGEEFKDVNTSPRNEQESIIEIPFDDRMSYFFMFGVKGSGKSSILSSLIYYLRVLRVGDSIDKLSKTHLDFDRRGEELMDEFYKQVSIGLFPMSTATLSSEGEKVPRQMPLSFKPADTSKSEFRLCLMDISGEDLMKVRPDRQKTQERLPEGIEVFLDASQSNLCFILVYSVSEILSHSEQELYFDRFLDILTRKGLKQVPILLMLSKWDLVRNQYESVEDFLKKEARLIWNHVNQPDRNVTIMSFSIGHVDIHSNTYNYEHGDTEKLFNWMYSTQLGVDLNAQIDQSIFKRFWDRFNRSKK
jgi:GTPase SAR1 family protein